MKQTQQGFTLVEIAIVLVIIGLLLGGVLKGQELIENSRVKTAAADMNGISSAMNAYKDRYRRIPGDDGPALANLTARGGAWANITAVGNNNGVLAITAGQTFTGGGEGAAFWQHLKAAGLITGNPADAGVNALPRNAFNGLTGVTVAAAATQGFPVGTQLVCQGNVPGKNAQALDTQLDDGVGNAGSVRATVGANNVAPGAAAATYNENNTYTVCRTL